MDPRLLHHYNLELQYLRQMGDEFAKQFPKVAGRLGLGGQEVADPYVERLLEGVGFLAARVQLKLEAEFPRFTQAMLEIVHPHCLAPTPSMMVVQMKPNEKDPNLVAGQTIPRLTSLQNRTLVGAGTACQFQTAHEVTLWPVTVVGAKYFSFAPDLPLNQLPVAVRGGLRIRLRAAEGLEFAQTAIDALAFFVSGVDTVASHTLFDRCAGATVGALVRPAEAGAKWHEFLPASCVRPMGFGDDEALLPVTPRSLRGYRLLQEYFAFPARFRFFEIGGLAPAIRRARTNEIEIVLLFNRSDSTLERLIDESYLALHCTPAINLFPKRPDRIRITESAFEYHVVVDRTRPLDFEVYEVTSVVGHGVGKESEQHFLPLYSANSRHGSGGHSAAFTTRREPRMATSSARTASQTSYAGSEVFLGLVDSAHAPLGTDLRQLSMQALCTNRGLPTRAPLSVGSRDLSLDVSSAVTDVEVMTAPSAPAAPLAGNGAWRAISHLSLNYLSLLDVSPEEGAAPLRKLLGLYTADASATSRSEIEGIRSVTVKPVVRRVPNSRPIAFGRGLEITVTVDPMAFTGSSAYLLGSVLREFFARHVSINSFTEMVLRLDGRDEPYRWGPTWGMRPTL